MSYGWRGVEPIGRDVILMRCERPKCGNDITGDLLYCSDRCYELDSDPVPVQPLARNKVNGLGNGLALGRRQAVWLSRR